MYPSSLAKNQKLFLLAYDTNRAFAMQLGVCTNACFGSPDTWLLMKDDDVHSDVGDAEGVGNDAKRRELINQYVNDGFWPNTKNVQTKNVPLGVNTPELFLRRPPLHSEADSVDSSTSNRSRPHTPLLRLGLGDIHAPTPLERRATLVLDIDHGDEETIAQHTNTNDALIAYTSQDDTDFDEFESANEVNSSEGFESATDDDHNSGSDSKDSQTNAYNEKLGNISSQK